MYNCSNKLKISEQNRPEKSSPPPLHLPEFIWSKWLISFCLGSFVFPADLSCFRTAGRGVVTMETLKRTTCHQEVLMNICTIWIKLCTNSLMFFSSSSSHSLQPDSVIFWVEARLLFIRSIMLFTVALRRVWLYSCKITCNSSRKHFIAVNLQPGWKSLSVYKVTSIWIDWISDLIIFRSANTSSQLASVLGRPTPTQLS